MAESAPDALKWLGSRIAPDLGGVLSGIVGDEAHTRGYHRGRAYVPSTDYSVQLAEDKRGSSYYACAIDMSFTTSKMKLYTGRLRDAAARNDPRLKYVREFYGTIDGTTVFGRTHKGSGDSTWEWSTSDKSHLWHIHISILREYSNNRSVMQGILDVLMGKPLATPVEEEDDMAYTDAQMKAFPWQYVGGGIPDGMSTLKVLNDTYIQGREALAKLDVLAKAVNGLVGADLNGDIERLTAQFNAERQEMHDRVDALQVYVGEVDEAVVAKLQAKTPEETAALLKAILGDQADEVFRAGLAAEGFVI